jgi:hypothetical protein
MSDSAKLVKMLGPGGWCSLADGYPGQITRAILRENKTLVIDLTCGVDVYSVTLSRRTGDLFEGQWSCRAGGTTYTGAASGRLYESSSGRLLFGEWAEDGTRYQWWVELEVVTHFPDEKQATRTPDL